jgi:hypothetical protein
LAPLDAPLSGSADLAAAAAAKAAGDAGQAEAGYRAVLARQPDHGEALLELGGMLQLQGRHAEALAIADHTLRGRPGCGEAWIVRGDALLNTGRLEEALKSFQRASRARSCAFDAHLRIGIVQGDLGRTPAAMKAFADALALSPKDPYALYRRGIARLKAHDFARGWDDYEARWDWPAFSEHSRGQVPRAMIPQLGRRPSPEGLAGKRVLLVGEQGVGDQIMFLSMLPDLLSVAASVFCVCEPRLVNLFRASFPGVTFAAPAEAQVDHEDIDVVIAMASLGPAFRRDPTTFPGRPYLTPGPEARARWAERLGPRTAALRVGVSWRGGTGGTNRAERSLALEDLRPILDLPGCEFVNLQYGDVEAELAAVNAGREAPVRNFPAESLHDFEDIAALTANLDLVVTVQTAQAHVSGAIGGPALVMVPFNAIWRYGGRGAAMPWYGSVELIRQPAPGDWAPVLEQVRGKVAALAPQT